MTKESDYQKKLNAINRIREAFKKTLADDPDKEDEIEFLRRRV